MPNNEKTYSSSQVSNRLSIEPVTVRKYSQMLEHKGYIFQKDNNNWRMYSEDDITFLKYICNMRDMGKPLDESIDHIANLYQLNLSISKPDTTIQNPQNQVFEFMKNQQELNQKILEKLEVQEQRQNERDQNLMNVLRESQEVKKQLANIKQKKWWEFWKK